MEENAWKPGGSCSERCADRVCLPACLPLPACPRNVASSQMCREACQNAVSEEEMGGREGSPVPTQPVTGMPRLPEFTACLEKCLSD